MIDLAREWLPFVALVALGWLLRKAISSGYERLSRRIDAKVPDDMPCGGGAWLDEQLRARGLEGEIRVFADGRAGAHVDAYFPTARTIVLSRAVHEKHDASFWAVAGHELGHALVRRAAPVVGVVFSIGRILTTVCTRTATFLIFANVLYASADIDSIAFDLLRVSLVAWIVVLVDEALASLLSIRMLAKDARVSRRALVGAVTALIAAFMTYAGAVVGQIILVLQRDFIVGQIHRHRVFVAGAPMSTARLAVVLALSVVLVALSLRTIVRRLRVSKVDDIVGVAKAGFFTLLDDFVRGFFGAAIVALVWDQPLGRWFPLVCVAGLLASAVFVHIAAYVAEKVVRLVAAIVVMPVFLVVYVAIGLIFGDGKETKEVEPPPMSKRTGSEYDRLYTQLHNERTWYGLADALVFPALHILFVAALCVAIFIR